MASLVQSKSVVGVTVSATYDTAPVAGNLLVATLAFRGFTGAMSISGWTHVAEAGGNGYVSDIWYRAAPGGSVTVSPTGSSAEVRLTIMEFDTAATLAASTTDGGLWPSPTHDGVGTFAVGDVTVGAGILVGIVAAGDPGGGGHTDYTEDAAYTNLSEGSVATGLTPDSDTAYQIVTGGTYQFAPTGITIAGGHPSWGGVLAAFLASPPFTADFSGTPLVGNPGLSVAFTDHSSGGTGTPNSWAWDFGDGETSTSQNPTHVYALAGAYDVTLTVTTDDAETDDLTRTSYVRVGDVFVPPPPSNAVVEIYVAAAGSARWGVAHWGVDVWSSAGWVDVTPQSVDATVRWGSHAPERGILAETEAASWIVDTYDPERLMDPGNPDTPYAADLRAGLPIRIRHRGTIVRQGIAETIAYYHKAKQGGIRATDLVSLLARTPVPSDTGLSDTLRARARDVIAAAGLRVTVEPDPPSGDPALAPRLDGDRSAWRHVSDAAEQTLHIAYVDRIGTLKFRPWATPYDRARFVDGTNLVDLGAIVQTDGLYSVVQAQQTVGDGGDLIERRLTPVPRYGPVTYTRTDETIDADAWAAAVLADRSLQGIQWVPGDIYPLDADDVEYFATMEALERISVLHDDADPPVAITGNIIGGEFRVVSKKLSEALWTFSLELAQTGTAETSPLVDDIGGEFLLNETSDAYLYPD